MVKSLGELEDIVAGARSDGADRRRAASASGAATPTARSRSACPTAGSTATVATTAARRLGARRRPGHGALRRLSVTPCRVKRDTDRASCRCAARAGVRVAPPVGAARARSGCEFDIVPADIDESALPGETPSDYVARLSNEKAARRRRARRWRRHRHRGRHDGRRRRRDPREADRRRRRPPHAPSALRTHPPRPHRRDRPWVPASRGSGRPECRRSWWRRRCGSSSSTERAIDWYIATGEPFGKAGGYAIQGAGWGVRRPHRRQRQQRDRPAARRDAGPARGHCRRDRAALALSGGGC